jgi:hypothetical protein
VWMGPEMLDSGSIRYVTILTKKVRYTGIELAAEEARDVRSSANCTGSAGRKSRS